MKRFLLAILLVCFVLTGCSGVRYTAYAYRGAYLGEFSGDELDSKTEFITSLDGLDQYRIELQISFGDETDAISQLNTYTDEFFEEHALILISLWESSGSNRLSVKGVSCSDGVVRVKLKRKAPKMGTADMCPWAFIIECEKNPEIEKAEFVHER